MASTLGAWPFPGSTWAAPTGPVSSWLTSVLLATDSPLCAVWGGQPRGLGGRAGGLQGAGSGRGITSLWDLALLGPLQQPALLDLLSWPPVGSALLVWGPGMGREELGRGSFLRPLWRSLPGAPWDKLGTSLASWTPWSPPAPTSCVPPFPAPGLLSSLPTPQFVTGVVPPWLPGARAVCPGSWRVCLGVSRRSHVSLPALTRLCLVTEPTLAHASCQPFCSQREFWRTTDSTWHADSRVSALQSPCRGGRRDPP